MSASFYEEVEIEDMHYDAELQCYTYPCPCGDKFVITLEELYDGEDIGICPSCTLRIKVIYDEESLPPLLEYFPEDEEGESAVVSNVVSATDVINENLEALKVSNTTDDVNLAVPSFKKANPDMEIKIE